MATWELECSLEGDIIQPFSVFLRFTTWLSPFCWIVCFIWRLKELENFSPLCLFLLDEAVLPDSMFSRWDFPETWSVTVPSTGSHPRARRALWGPGAVQDPGERPPATGGGCVALSREGAGRRSPLRSQAALLNCARPGIVSCNASPIWIAFLTCVHLRF